MALGSRREKRQRTHLTESKGVQSASRDSLSWETVSLEQHQSVRQDQSVRQVTSAATDEAAVGWGQGWGTEEGWDGRKYLEGGREGGARGGGGTSP